MVASAKLKIEGGMNKDDAGAEELLVTQLICRMTCGPNLEFYDKESMTSRLLVVVTLSVFQEELL